MINVAVLMGGISAEAEVSRSSAREVAAGLSEAGHSVTKLEIDKDLPARLVACDPQVVFPVLHGPPGEDGTIQGLLEMMDLPYVGSGVRASAMAMDKAVAKLLFRTVDLPVAEGASFHPDEDIEAVERSILEHFGDRVVIKPLDQGSAIGVTPVANGGDLKPAIRTARAHGGYLVEPYILGREITVGVFDPFKGEPVAFPVIEIRTGTDQWYDYTNRYAAGASEHVIPAPLAADVNVRLQEISLAAHRVLGCRDLSRADFIVTDEDEIVLLEVNTLPGMTPTSLYPDGARATGMDFVELVDALVGSAWQRSQALSTGR
jgi:D-alanine-D-alanine ligase